MREDKRRGQSALKSQDVLVACKLWSLGDTEWSFLKLGAALGISASAAHGSWTRLRKAKLVVELSGGLKIARRRLFELLAHGAPLTFYAEKGAVSSGMPTSFHAEPVKAHGVPTNGHLPLVWPVKPQAASKKPQAGLKLGASSLQLVEGESIEPVYPSAPKAASEDAQLYELLALFDAVRAGQPKERRIAIEILERKLCSKEEVT